MILLRTLEGFSLCVRDVLMLGVWLLIHSQVTYRLERKKVRLERKEKKQLFFISWSLNLHSLSQHETLDPSHLTISTDK